MKEFSSSDYMQYLFGDRDPVECIYETIINNKNSLPENFVIHSSDKLNINIPQSQADTRKFFLDTLMNVFVEREDYLKCQEIQQIKNKLNYEHI